MEQTSDSPLVATARIKMAKLVGKRDRRTFAIWYMLRTTVNRCEKATSDLALQSAEKALWMWVYAEGDAYIKMDLELKRRLWVELDRQTTLAKKRAIQPSVLTATTDLAIAVNEYVQSWKPGASIRAAGTFAEDIDYEEDPLG